MVSTRPVISKSFGPFSYPLAAVSKAPITIGIIVTFILHSFFSSLASTRYLFLLSLSLNFTLWSTGTAKFTILQFLFFLLIIIRSGCLAEIKWSVSTSKSDRSLFVSFSRVDHIQLVPTVKLRFLAKILVGHPANLVMSSLICFLC